MKLRCLICNTEHKATSQNFPLASHKKMPNKEGKLEDRIVGYICIKCCRKQVKRERKEDKNILKINT